MRARSGNRATPGPRAGGWPVRGEAGPCRYHAQGARTGATRMGDVRRRRVEMRDALMLGAVQGLTEFLPISSSAHLALLRRLTGHADAPRAFDVALHLATT